MEPFAGSNGHISRSFKKGDEWREDKVHIQKEVFAELVRENKVPMYRLAYGILRNQMDAEDAVSEAVVKAFERLNSLREPEKFKPWIMQIVANEARKLYGKKKRVDLVEDASEMKLYHEDAKNELWDIVVRLDEKSRAVVILFYYEQLSLKEIGGVLDISEGTVKSRLFRAKEKLRVLLA